MYRLFRWEDDGEWRIKDSRSDLHKQSDPDWDYWINMWKDDLDEQIQAGYDYCSDHPAADWRK